MMNSSKKVAAIRPKGIKKIISYLGLYFDLTLQSNSIYN